jgi:Protein of unknown function (DUF4232)
MMRNRLVGGALLAVAAAVVIAAAAGTALAHRSSATSPRCRVRALQVWIGLGEGTGAAGSNFYPLEFSNISHQTCQLFGFPGVSAFGLHQIGKPAGRSGGPGVAVTLAPRQTGHAVLQISDAGNFNPATCKPVNASELRVFPPNAAKAELIPFTFRACSGTPVFMEVRSVHRRVGVPGF